MHRCSWVALLAAVGAFAPLSVYAQNAAPRVEAELRSGDNGTLAGGVFVPFALGDGQVVFADGWLSYQDGGPVYGSIGGGVRGQFGEWVLGANASLEFAHSPYGFNYQQISAGLEALGTQYEFRLNGYAPLGTTSNAIDGLSAVAIRNGSFVTNQGYEVALYGVDAEAGVRLPVFDADSPSSVKFFVGAFAQGSSLSNTITGVSGRAELTLGLDQYLPGATLSFGAGLRYDSNEQLSGTAMVRLSAPIGGTPETVQTQSPLYQRVERNRAIATKGGAFGADEALFAGSGSGEVLQLSAADGSASALNSLIAAAGEGTVILLSGDITLDETMVLLSNQILVGGGGVIDLATTDGKKFSYTNDGAATVLSATTQTSSTVQTLAAPIAVDGIKLADGTTVSTLSIIGTEDGIVGEGVQNITIDNVNISGVSGNGITLKGVDNATISNSRIANTYLCETNSTCEFSIFDPTYVPNAAINAVGVTGLSISNLDISDVTYGIFIAPEINDSDWPSVVTHEASNISISNVSITNSRREALMTVGAHDIDIDELHVDNSGLNRDMDLVVFQTSHNITLTNSTLNGGVNALMFAYYSGIPGENPNNITVSNVQISDTSRAGIFINPSHDLTFSNVTITNAGTYGLYMYGDNWGFMGGPITDVSFDDVVIESAADGALYFTGPLENIDGNLVFRDATPLCSASTGPWTGTAITQDAGLAFSINGTELTDANIETLCAN